MNSPSQKSNTERRRSNRRPILDTFSLFVVVPKKGIHRLKVHDISEHGIGFDLDIEDDPTADYPVKSGEVLAIQLYLNQSLYLPLTVQVARVETRGSVRKIGADFKDRSSKTHKAYASFLKMLDDLVDVVQLASG